MVPEILSRLEGVTKTASGWSARCPAHDDNTASLSIAIGDDGRTLLHDHAGCEPDAILAVVNMTLADLMPKENGKARGRIVAEYDYRDESGKLLYQSVRFEPKGFGQRTPQDGGGWSWKRNGVRYVLYRLPELLATEPSTTIFIPEGEKDCLELVKRGLNATCNVGGALKWRKEYSPHLAEHAVVVLADNDDKGREHAAAVANSVKAAGAPSVKVVDLPGLKPKGDVSDWLADGGTVEALEAIVGATPEWVPTKAERKKRRQTIIVTTESLDPRGASARTDAANAKRLAQLYGADLRWCEVWGKWLAFDGRRWAIDSQRRVDAMAKDVAEALWRQTAVLLPDLDFATARDLTAFARTTASARGISAMLTLAKSEPGVPILPGQLDCDPWALNVLNGTLDLRTGELRAHERAEYITKLCPVEYDATAICQTWEAMLATLMADNRELIEFLQRSLGYSLTGDVSEQVLLLLYGAGANGKSTFLNAVMATIGSDFAMQAADGLLTVKNGETHPTERADLFGKRFVSSIELDDGKRLAESLVKQLTGGDTIRARRMREDHWQFDPTHELWLATNHKPVIRGTDHGIWRRIRLIPFEVTVAKADQDTKLPEKLAGERAGILAWMVRGCLAWQQQGLGEPEAVADATNAYRNDMDVVGAFLAECCIENHAFSAKASNVYSTYATWCRANGEYAVNQRRFGLAVSERGIDRYTNNGMWYRGLGLPTEPTEPTERFP